MKTWAVFFTTLLCVFSAHGALSETEKIESLLAAVETLDATFLRNGEEHSAKEAASHLRRKLKSAQSSLFAPKREKWTAEMFITKIASKSSFSGKSYLILFPNGKIVPADVWLLEQCQTLH